jgi:hypothetical protein
VLRGAPGASYLNKAEGPMSNLNIGLQHLSLKREPIEHYAEDLVTSSGSMTEIRRISMEYQNFKEAELERLARRLSLLLEDEAKEEASIMEQQATLEREEETERATRLAELEESNTRSAGERQQHHQAALSILGLVNIVDPRQNVGQSRPSLNQDSRGGYGHVTNHVTINTTHLTMTSYAPSQASQSRDLPRGTTAGVALATQAIQGLQSENKQDKRISYHMLFWLCVLSFSCWRPEVLKLNGPVS